MTTYTDTTQEVFRRIILLLQPNLTPAALQIVQDAIESQQFHNADQVLKDIEDAVIGPQT